MATSGTSASNFIFPQHLEEEDIKEEVPFPTLDLNIGVAATPESRINSHHIQGVVANQAAQGDWIGEREMSKLDDSTNEIGDIILHRVVDQGEAFDLVLRGSSSSSSSSRKRQGSIAREKDDEKMRFAAMEQEEESRPVCKCHWVSLNDHPVSFCTYCGEYVGGDDPTCACIRDVNWHKREHFETNCTVCGNMYPELIDFFRLSRNRRFAQKASQRKRQRR